MLRAFSKQFKMDFITKLTEKLSLSKKEEAVPFVRIPGLLDQLADDKAEFETTITKIRKESPDSYVYSFALADPEQTLGLQIGHHVCIHANVPTATNPVGDRIKRAYTPISKINQKGYFDLLIKIYRAKTHPDFPRGGPLTQYIETLKVGDKVTMTGPVFKLTYHGNGKFVVKGTELNVTEVGLIAGGTGVAPMYQLIRAIMDDPTDKTKVYLLFANKSEADILLRDELKDAVKDPRIKVSYTLDQGSSSWKGFTGFISKEILEKSMPKPDSVPLLWACGPKPMQRLAKIQLKELGYDVENAVM